VRDSGVFSGVRVAVEAALAQCHPFVCGIDSERAVLIVWF